jgi:flagellar hook-length control protein FliK
MMTAIATSTAAPAAGANTIPESSAPPAGTPVDFTALLLLLLGVGAATSNPDPQVGGDGGAGADDDPVGSDTAKAPAPPAAATAPAAAAALSVGLAAATSLPISIAPNGLPTAPAPETGRVSPAGPAVGDAASAPSVTTASPTVEGTATNTAMAPTNVRQAGDVAIAELEPITAPEVSMASTGGNAAAIAQQTTSDGRHDREPAPASIRPSIASGSAGAAHTIAVAKALARAIDAASDAGDEGVQRSLPHRDARASATDASAALSIDSMPMPSMPAAPHAVTDGTAPAPPLEPRVVAGQIVSAARIVVREGSTHMRVDLDPPELGAVRVSAEARGDSLTLTISAERPETQMLLRQALPDIHQALSDQGVRGASVAVLASPLSDTGRRAPDRRPAEPRERPNPSTPQRRRVPRASRPVSAVDITV